MIERTAGMILVTGPTGSGKTTTLYAALHHINSPTHKIITAEDPVEYRLERINQVQVNPKIGLTFATVLRTALRQDPDIVLVGEMRDRETVEMGLRAAMTGHLVLSTLHTTNAVTTISRLLDMGAEGFLIASALHGVLAQRLMRRICDSCSQAAELTPRQRIWIDSHGGKTIAENTEFHHGIGCTYCNMTGYRGRIGIYELLEIDGPLADAIRQRNPSQVGRLAQNQAGFVPLIQRALAYAIEKVTSVQEVIRITSGLEEKAPAAPGLLNDVLDSEGRLQESA
jgi:MSHA biogenesis protein MshE